MYIKIKTAQISSASEKINAAAQFKCWRNDIEFMLTYIGVV